LRVREEVAIEEMDDSQVVILSPEPCRVDERLTIEIPGDSRRRLNVKVRESRPAIEADGAIRHRLKLQIEQHVHDGSKHGGRDL
jgi:hypothetical protein